MVYTDIEATVLSVSSKMDPDRPSSAPSSMPCRYWKIHARRMQVRMVDTTDGQEKPVMQACGHDIHITALIVSDKIATLQLGPGYSLAGKKTFKFAIHGRGGYSSAPQECIYPIVITCSLWCYGCRLSSVARSTLARWRLSPVRVFTLGIRLMPFL